jgi:transposase
MTVPGVGAVVALTYATAVAASERFVRSRDIGTHFGLTPRKYASGEIDRNGAISKCGDGAARQALFQAALSLLTRTQRWSLLKAWSMALAQRRSLKRATVAVAPQTRRSSASPVERWHRLPLDPRSHERIGSAQPFRRRVGTMSPAGRSFDDCG